MTPQDQFRSNQWLLHFLNSRLPKRLRDANALFLSYQAPSEGSFQLFYIGWFAYSDGTLGW